MEAPASELALPHTRTLSVPASQWFARILRGKSVARNRNGSGFADVDGARLDVAKPDVPSEWEAEDGEAGEDREREESEERDQHGVDGLRKGVAYGCEDRESQEPSEGGARVDDADVLRARAGSAAQSGAKHTARSPSHE